jgi:Domain of unknown function (DUF932)
MASSLIAHVDCKYITRDQLQFLSTPAPTKTWLPVPHYDLVTALSDELGRRGITITREEYAVGGFESARLFGTMDLCVPDVEDEFIGTSLGIRTANDRTMQMQVVAAARVFVCDNMSFSGSSGAVFLKKRHTSGLNLGEALPPAIEMYLDKSGAWRADIDRMREFSLTDGRAKELIYDAFMGRKEVLPLRLLDDVHTLYFDDEIQREKFEDRTLWSLNNAFTEAVKTLKAVPQQRRGTDIGRYFGKVLHQAGQRAGGIGSYRPAKMLPGRIG